MLVHELAAANGGVLTHAQLRTVLSRRALAEWVDCGALTRVCHGVYALEDPDEATRLRALDLMTGRRLVGCMSTAARVYGFDTERDDTVHIFDPGVRVRPTAGVLVHQRVGAPLCKVDGRLLTTPAWTAVEVARLLKRPRALATLDAALRSGRCDRAELDLAVAEQKGRRGIVAVRNLLPHADPRAESPMESEARLVFIDGGLPTAELQYEIVDLVGDLWRVDFAWPEAGVVAEYDSMEFHGTPEGWKRDRIKHARLRDCGLTVLTFVVDDVRRYPAALVARVSGHLVAGARAS